MTTAEKEPAPTIRAELGRRRLTVARLAETTNMSTPRIQRRLDAPGTLQLDEVAVIAAALDVDPEALIAPWVAQIKMDGVDAARRAEAGASNGRPGETSNVEGVSR